MFCKFTVGSFLYFSLLILNINEILTYPLEFELLNAADLGYELFNSSDLLVYQKYDLVEAKSSKRNKRWLEELYSYFYDSSEEDSSSEEDDDDDSSDYKSSSSNSKYKNRTAYGLCHDCTVTYNQVHQVQHINRVIHSNTLNDSSTTPINSYEIKSVLTTPKPRRTNSPQGKTIESNVITTVSPKPFTAQPTTSDAQTPIAKMATTEAVTKVQMTTIVSETPKLEIKTVATPVAPGTFLTLVTTLATTAEATAATTVEATAETTAVPEPNT